jgi:hypothetical protein
MPVLTCPSCHCKLRLPQRVVGKRAVCPQCRAPLSFRVVAKAGGHRGTKRYRPVPPPAEAETVDELPALAKTVEQEAVRVGKEVETDAPPATVSGRQARPAGVVLRIGVLATLAAAGAFALWMAAAGDR